MAVFLAVPLFFLAWPGLVPSWFFEAPSWDPEEAADAIVFLGGDMGPRERQSLRLLEEGRGRFLLVTGENGYTTRRIQALLPPEKRVVEPAATSTWENARYSSPLLRARGVKSAILVTDWWHSRRALACFRRACPDVKLSVAPVRVRGTEGRAARSTEFLRREYVARLWYGLRYAVW